MSGMILPAGSPLVQFEVQRYHPGKEPDKTVTLPVVIWVDRRPRKCWSCKEVAFAVPVDIANSIDEHRESDYEAPLVCGTMGRFVE